MRCTVIRYLMLAINAPRGNNALIDRCSAHGVDVAKQVVQCRVSRWTCENRLLVSSGFVSGINILAILGKLIGDHQTLKSESS